MTRTDRFEKTNKRQNKIKHGALIFFFIYTFFTIILFLYKYSTFFFKKINSQNMDIDSDDGDGYDPLLSSIFDAMNSVKEATADKIYQKIRREGNINFSKPQVRFVLLTFY